MKNDKFSIVWIVYTRTSLTAVPRTRQTSKLPFNYR